MKDGNLAKLEPELIKAVKLNPNSFDANYNLGEFYLHSGKLRDGIPYMEKAQRLQPFDYVSGYDLALAFFETGNYAKTREQIRAMLRRKDSAELHSLLADVEEKAGNYVTAAQEYQRATQMEPTEDHIFDLGTELLVHQTFEPAIEVFKRGIESYPRSAKLNIGLGVALYGRGNYDGAIKALLPASDLDPSQPLPYVLLGKVYSVSATNADEVTQRLSRFAQLQPNNPEALYYYAMSLWKGHREADSQVDLGGIESLLKKAVGLDPAFADAHLQLGILYTNQRKYPEAIPEFERVAALQPNLAEAHYRLAQAYVRTGGKGGASQQYQINDQLHKRELADAQREFQIYERLHKQEQAETEKVRNEIQQFVITMKEQGSTAQAK